MSRPRDSSQSNKHGLAKRDGKVLTSISTLSNSLRESLSLHPTAPSPCTSSFKLSEIPANEWRDPLAGNFVNYLPQDEAVAAGVGSEEGGLDAVESQKVVDLLNKELSRLLKLSSRDFWREVAIDSSLHEFLDSFLKYRNRWYDFSRHRAKGVLTGVIIGDIDLCRRVFMVLYRISSSRDPGIPAADSFNSKEHAVILQEKKLLDLPKLLDISAIYGHENEELTRFLVMNAIKAQPNINDNLTAVLTHFLCIMNTMHQRCFSSLEDQSCHEDCVPSPLIAEFLEVVDFINDAVSSMDAFIAFYRPAAFYFSCRVQTSYGNEELVMTIARLHDALLPSLEHWFRLKLSADEETLSKITVNLKVLSDRMVEFGWKLLDSCYLRDEVPEDLPGIPIGTKMFPSQVDDPLVRADILIQTFKDVNGVAFLRCIDETHHLMNRLQNLQISGWIVMDGEHVRYLSGLLQVTEEEEKPVFQTAVDEEEAAIKESKVTGIKDLFPDYGQGFLSACLEVYNQNEEEVIQRILEGTLHEDLKQLDSSLETLPLQSRNSAPAVAQTKKNKGKAVVESATPRVSRKTDLDSASSSVAVDGRFVRKSDQLWPSASSILDARNNGDAEAMAARYVLQCEYEDEYDDSFDDLGFITPESGLEERDEESTDGVGDGTTLRADAGTRLGSKSGRPRFYVKDGKNYSYKVKGGASAGVADAQEAALVSQGQEELIYGLGPGGNIPTGSMNKMSEHFGEDDEVEHTENQRGRGRGRGKGRGRGSSHNRKAKALNKHTSGLAGY